VNTRVSVIAVPKAVSSVVRNVTVSTWCLVQPVDQPMMHKGHQIEAGSYCVGNLAWSPRAVVSVRFADGGLRRTPLYSTSSAKCPTQHEADRQAVDIAGAWFDAAVDQPRPPDT